MNYENTYVLESFYSFFEEKGPVALGAFGAAIGLIISLVLSWVAFSVLGGIILGGFVGWTIGTFLTRGGEVLALVYGASYFVALILGTYLL